MNQKERRNSMDYSRREHGSGSEGLSGFPLFCPTRPVPLFALLRTRRGSSLALGQSGHPQKTCAHPREQKPEVRPAENKKKNRRSRWIILPLAILAVRQREFKGRPLLRMKAPGFQPVISSVRSLGTMLGAFMATLDIQVTKEQRSSKSLLIAPVASSRFL